MKHIFEHRASTILYRIFVNQQRKGIWLIPANVCPVVAATLIKAEIPFELVDIDASTLLMNEVDILHRISSHPDRYAGVLWVDTYGVINNAEIIFKNIKLLDEKIFTLHDRCLAVPEFESKLGDFTDAIVFSTGYGKYLDLGYGGYAWLKDHVEYSIIKTEFRRQDLKKLEAFLKSTPNEALTLGFGICKSDWIESESPDVLLQDHLKKVQQDLHIIQNHKDSINNIYTAKIPAPIQLPMPYQNWRFNIIVPNKRLLLKSIFEARLFASSHYAPLNHFFGKREKSPVAQKLYNNVVNLFNDKHFSKQQASLVTDIVNRHIDIYGR